MAFGEGSETGEDQASIAQGYMGLVFKYGSEKEVIPIISPDRADGLEFWVSNKIREIRDKADNLHHKIGVVSGKDEIKLSDSNLVPAQGQNKGPSIKAIIGLGWRHITTVLGSTVVIFAIVTGGLLLIQLG